MSSWAEALITRLRSSTGTLAPPHAANTHRLTLRTPIVSHALLALGDRRSLLARVSPPPIVCACLSRLVLPRTVHRNFGVAGPVDTRDLHKHHMTFAMFHRSHYEVSVLVFVWGFTFVGPRDFSCFQPHPHAVTFFLVSTAHRLSVTFFRARFRTGGATCAPQTLH